MAAATSEKIKVLNKIYGEYIDFESSTSTVSNYTKLADEYEKDFVGMGYDTPDVLAKTAVKNLANNCTSTTIFDAACGTGLVADGLLKAGYKGTIDGLDGSSGMLQLAEKKGMYKELVEAFIYPDKQLDVSDNHYDGVVCCGGFGPGHLEPASLRELVRIVKPGGVVVFATRYNEQATGYVRNLNEVMEQLVNEKKWVVKENYTTNYFDIDFCNNEKSLLASIYCYQKV